MRFNKLRQLMTSPGIIVWAGSAMLLLITILIHHDSLNGGWRGDDLSQLMPARDHSFSQLFFSPRDWQSFNTLYFTPILMGQYKLDLILFGFNPSGFFLHNLINLTAATILGYHLLARRCHPLVSFLASIGFLLAMPTFTVVNFLQNSHYVSGLIFAIASIYVHQNAYRDNLTRNLLTSTGLFLLALMCKEIYAMTLLYFLLKSWRSPAFVKTLGLYSTALLVFIAWRWQMLGTLVGGQGFEGPFIGRINAVARIHRIIFGNDIVAIACLGTIGAVAIHHRLLNVRHLIQMVAFVLAIYLPLLFATHPLLFDPVAGIRLAFFPAWLLFAGVACIATLLWEKGNKKTAVATLLGFLATTTTASMQQLTGFRNLLKEFDVQTAFIRNGGPESAIFLSPIFVGADGNTNRRFAQLAGLAPSNVIVSRDDLVPGIKSYWTYDAHCKCMVQYSPIQAQERLAKILLPPADNAAIALLAVFQTRQGMLHFMMAPDANSSCIVTVPGMLGKTCPTEKSSPNGMLPAANIDLSRARIHRIRNDGLATSTPGLQLPWTGTVRWERGVFLPSQSRLTMQQTSCRMDSPAPGETHLKRSSPLKIEGWIQASPDVKPDATPFAVLSRENGKYFESTLYRKPRPNAEISAAPTPIGAHVLDADLSRVEPGAYRLLLGVENVLCDTGVRLVVE